MSITQLTFNKMAKSKIKFNDVSSANGTQKIQLPKYSSQVINLANGYSKATRPANVGQVSEDIKTFRDDETLIGYTNQDWINWHKNKYPEVLFLLCMIGVCFSSTINRNRN